MRIVSKSYLSNHGASEKMPPSSHLDPSDQIQDTISHDTCKTTPDTRCQERESNKGAHELQKVAAWSAPESPKQPPTTQVERDQVAGVLSAPKHSQRSEPENMDGPHAPAKNKVVLGEDGSTSDQSEISRLSQALESRLTLSEQPSLHVRTTVGKTESEARRQSSNERRPFSSSRRRFSIYTQNGPTCGDGGRVECFVSGCGTTKSFISELLYATLWTQNGRIMLTIRRRHGQQAHSFFYCNECCNGFKTWEAKMAYLPQCSNYCMSPTCVAVDAAVSCTGDPQTQRHVRTQECPTVGRVQDDHKLEFLKCVFRSLYPDGMEPVAGQ